jgi:hypothetical protein
VLVIVDMFPDKGEGLLAICNIEHEREGALEEIEFQIKWEHPQ